MRRLERMNKEKFKIILNISPDIELEYKGQISDLERAKHVSRIIHHNINTCNERVKINIYKNDELAFYIFTQVDFVTPTKED